MYNVCYLLLFSSCLFFFYMLKIDLYLISLVWYVWLKNKFLILIFIINF